MAYGVINDCVKKVKNQIITILKKVRFFINEYLNMQAIFTNNVYFIKNIMIGHRFFSTLLIYQNVNFIHTSTRLVIELMLVQF